MTPPPPIGTAGTAGDHYRTDQPEHPYREAAHDPGERPRCTRCGRERHHTPSIPSQRDGRPPA